MAPNITVDELVTRLQAIQARGGGKLQVAYPNGGPQPQAVYQLIVSSTDPNGKGVLYVCLNPGFPEIDLEVPKDLPLDKKP